MSSLGVFTSYAFKLGIVSLLLIKELQADDNVNQLLFRKVHKG